MINKLSIAFLLLILIYSCESKEKSNIIASVDDKNLYFSDLKKVIPNNITDSVYFVEKYINEWIRRELMISHAEMNLSEDLLKFDKQIEDYRTSLIIYAYKQELINQNLDTLISFSEIEQYFKERKDKFVLDKSIFKGRFVAVDKSAPRLTELTKWYKSEDINNILLLKEYCLQFSKQYFVADSIWQDFSKINNSLPNLIEDEKYFLKNNKAVWYEDEFCRYYIYIKDYLIKGSQSPLEFESKKIKNILLNKKKNDYLKQIENELYQNALVTQKIKIY